MSRVRVVCFDLGGVVVRICRSFEESVLASGVPLRPLPARSDLHVHRGELVERHQTGRIDAAEFHRAMSAAVDGVYRPDEVALIHRAVLRGEYEGIADVVRALDRAGLRTACLSNTNDEHWTELVRMPAIAAMHERHASHLFGLSKPGEAIYRRFEEVLGARGGEILFFDDLADNIATAARLGWDAVRIDHEGDTAAQVRTALGERGVRC